MTVRRERAIARVRAPPDDMRDDAARMLLRDADKDGAIDHLTPEEEADLAESDAEVARGAFATDEAIRAISAKHGL